MRRRSPQLAVLVCLVQSLWGPAALVTRAAPAPQDALRALVGTSFTARVASVIDGDTIDVVQPGRRTRLRVRLEGIDSPEAGEPFSQTARVRTRVLAFDKDVRVSARDVDQYGRLVARITVTEGAAVTDVSVALVAAGLACHYRYYSADLALARAEADARAAGRGFWARGARRPSCVNRNTATPRGRSGP